MKFLHIHSKVIDTGVEILFRKRRYPITYPSFVWGVIPKETQMALKDNLAFATTMHLPLVFNSLGAVDYSGERAGV